ncbi:tetratricopeptide repeat protein [Archangium violaceum]|uniref:tetratricopeptide repeat protein n=1 Tax=Archangium violaceum TaxID=83451 RepID=UPI00194EE186|nr:tetratricopeptide repeat protein [Archangium violaceum]QRO00982.1 tetratricopeptide repeat protein [Archangium violaceum]
MRRTLLLSLLLMASMAHAQEKKAPRDANLGKKSSTAVVDKSLAGDISRKKEKQDNAPALQYDQFRLGVEGQVASKRREQIESLKKIISLSADAKEQPSLLFRLGELYWEESKYYFFEANRKDDELIEAMNRGDSAAQSRAKAAKAELLTRQKQYGKLALEQYTKIVQEYPDFERSDEVLFFLGTYLMEDGQDRKALVAFKRLVEKHPKSKYIPDAYLAFGEYYFNNSKGKRADLEKALAAYKKAAEFPESQVYAFALYKQGWCYFNLADYPNAKDKWKAVVLYGELAGAQALEKDGNAKKTNSLAREARTDYVRAYAREGDVMLAREDFSKVASNPEDRFAMMRTLANMYYGDGKDREAAITYNSLIKEKPLSPEAPGFQGRIVDIVLRMGNKERTVTQVRRLVKIMKEVEGSGVIKDDKDKKALAEAKDLSERTLSNLAVTWHNEAKKTREEATFGYADMIYSDYLTLFPESPKAYDLRFFWAELLNDNLQKFDKAAANYTLVVLQDVKLLEAKDEQGNPKPGKPGKWLNNAAYNAVLAYDEMVKDAESKGAFKDVDTKDIRKKAAIPQGKKDLLEACERYLKYVSKGDKRVEIAFKAANIYYRHNHFDEAVLRFSEIALGSPEYKFESGERAAEIAANLVLDSYNLLEDWAKVNEWARRFYNNDKLAVGKFREDLSKVIEQSAFKLVSQLEAKNQFAKAAEAYLSFVADFPQTEIADVALFNASVDYYKAKMLDKAIQVRQRIIEQYPASRFVPECIYNNAEALEAIGDFSEAADVYEQYVNGYEASLSGGGKAVVARKAAPARAKKGKGKGKAAASPVVSDKPGQPQKWEESKAQVALFNAATYREGLGQFKAALALRERYLTVWPKAKDAEDIFLSIVDLHVKTGNFNKAMGQLEEYERQYIRSPSKVLMAEGRIADIFENKMHKERDTARLYGRILDYYEKLPRRMQQSLEKPALEAVARAQYRSVEPDFQFYSRLKLSWGRPPSPDKLKGSIAEKNNSREVVEKKYVQTVSLGAAEPAICALHRIGLIYDNFADKISNAPMPPGIDEETEGALREEFGNQSLPLKEKAAEAFSTAVLKSRELSVFNTCAAESLKMLRDTYRPEQFPTMVEEKVALSKGRDLAIGGDLLAAIQDVPPPVVEAAQDDKGKTEEVVEDVSDLAKRLQQQTATQVDGPAAPTKEGTPRKSAVDDQEPEDFLK